MRTLILIAITALLPLAASADDRRQQREPRPSYSTSTYERQARENIRYENNANRRGGWSAEKDLQRRDTSPSYDRYREQTRYRY